jgi:predicted ATPase
VELASAVMPDDVAGVVADGLELLVGARSVSAETMAGTITGQRRLVVLDTCEHLLEPVACLADVLVARVPSLAVLATSREPLGVTREQV